MCFSASVSYSAAAILIATGIYTLYRSSEVSSSYRALAVTPLLFGIQQLFEGRVWQLLSMHQTETALPYALGFHFFSHFLWLWLIPLSSLLIEPERRRRGLFAAFFIIGATAGGMIYLSLLTHPDWMIIHIQGHSIRYQILSPYKSDLLSVIPPSVIYAVIILVPLLLSSHRQIRTFGMLLALSATFSSVAYGYAFVSVWCFFAAVIAIYLAFIIASLANNESNEKIISTSRI